MLNKFTMWLSGLLLGTGEGTLEGLGVKEIIQKSDVDAIFDASAQEPQFIFKHSTACPVSSAAYRRVKEFLQAAPEGTPPFHMVKVIEARPLSLSIADRLSVTHRSPQLILIKNGANVWNTSHGDITADAIKHSLAMI